MKNVSLKKRELVDAIAYQHHVDFDSKEWLWQVSLNLKAIRPEAHVVFVDHGATTAVPFFVGEEFIQLKRLATWMGPSIGEIQARWILANRMTAKGWKPSAFLTRSAARLRTASANMSRWPAPLSVSTITSYSGT